MKIEFTLEELKWIDASLELMMEEIDSPDIDELKDKIGFAIEDAQELQSIDLNSCGDACRL